MTRKMLFRFQFQSKEEADSFFASLNQLPGEVQPHDWSHTAQVIRQSGSEKGRLWEKYFVKLTAPQQAAQPLQHLAQKNSALKSQCLPGEEDFPGYGRQIVVIKPKTR
jgi:hypothetical protein